MKNIGICTGVLILAALITNAQKLPTVQTGGLRAPANIKVDGKATEWGDKYQAYNKNIEAFYTLSNDDENLYLTVKVIQEEIVDKIIRGGVSLIINHTVKKNDPEAVSVTYPVLRGGDMAGVTNLFAAVRNRQDDGTKVTFKQLNDYFGTKAKTAGIKGIKAIPEHEISVYNEEGIKALAMFGAKNDLVYELAIPIRYLNLPNGGTEAFSYRIKINEEPVTLADSSGGPPPPPMAPGGRAATDFWGEYTIIKK